MIYINAHILCSGSEQSLPSDSIFCFDAQKNELLFAWTIDDIASKIYPQTNYDSTYLGANKPSLDYFPLDSFRDIATVPSFQTNPFTPKNLLFALLYPIIFLAVIGIIILIIVTIIILRDEKKQSS
jgi:hypothetical protein